MTIPLSEATQVGVGSTAVEAAAWALLISGVVLSVLWVRYLYR
jgi:hypothetical protein